MGHVERGIVVESEHEWGWGSGVALLVMVSPRGNQAGPVDNSTQTGGV